MKTAVVPAWVVVTVVLPSYWVSSHRFSGHLRPMAQQLAVLATLSKKQARLFGQQY